MDSIVPQEWNEGLYRVIFNRELKTAYVEFSAQKPYLLPGWECTEPMYKTAAYVQMGELFVTLNELDGEKS